FVKDNGKRKVFHLGSNSSCRQHICSHYKFYKARCRELKIRENHYAMPCEML
ncbi:hypothetical protein DFJ58DRAFT_658852, partial [Suillus subalutaceus]|uniref:uncharacterized protein n=1 Tax=Suillus subalutaceus TaxID=48586 RepID=UPI001B85E3CA